MPERVGALPLSFTDLAIAACLVLVAGAVSLSLGARLEGKLAVASTRTVVQLLLVGYILAWVFRIDSLLVLGGVVLVMVGAAARAAVARAGRSFPGVHLRSFITLVLTSCTTASLVTALIVGVDPWWQPRYIIPLLGMVLGNGLTGISLCLDHMLETLSDRRDRVESDLALGATRWEAVREPLAEAVRRGMIPILNSMAVVGIVSLPGMMTGQILEGADPVAAVKYQIVVMFMLAAATAAGCMLIALFVYRRLFNDRHQLRWDLIRKRD